MCQLKTEIINSAEHPQPEPSQSAQSPSRQRGDIIPPGIPETAGPDPSAAQSCIFCRYRNVKGSGKKATDA